MGPEVAEDVAVIGMDAICDLETKPLITIPHGA